MIASVASITRPSSRQIDAPMWKTLRHMSTPADSLCCGPWGGLHVQREAELSLASAEA